MARRVDEFFLLVCIGILIRAILMGTQKMIKVIIGNYIVAGTCFAFGWVIYGLAERLAETPDQVFLWGITYEKLSHMLSAWELTFVFILFGLLVALVYTSSKIEFSLSNDPKVEKLYSILLVPLTLLSFIFTLFIALHAEGLGEVTMFVYDADTYDVFWFLSVFTSNIYVWMFFHWLIVLLITSRIRLKFSVAKQSTVIPEGLDDL